MPSVAPPGHASVSPYTSLQELNLFYRYRHWGDEKLPALANTASL